MKNLKPISSVITLYVNKHQLQGNYHYLGFFKGIVLLQPVNSRCTVNIKTEWMKQRRQLNYQIRHKKSGVFNVQLNRQGVLPDIKKNNRIGKTIKTLKKKITIMHIYATINIKIHNEVHKVKR